MTRHGQPPSTTSGVRLPRTSAIPASHSLEHDMSLRSAVDRQCDAFLLQPQLRTYLLADVRHGERYLARPAQAPVSTVAPSSNPFRMSRHLAAHDHL